MAHMAYVWAGGSKPLSGKVYGKGEEIPNAVVNSLRTKDALLSMGQIKVVTVEGDQTPSAPAKKKSTTKKKPAAKKTTAKKVESTSEAEEAPPAPEQE